MPWVEKILSNTGKKAAKETGNRDKEVIIGATIIKLTKVKEAESIQKINVKLLWVSKKIQYKLTLIS
jgi:hypothetical protein